MLLLSSLSSETSSATAYIIALFLNGFLAGALVNYTLSHVLHLTSPHISYIVTSLVAMARGFAGSFGSALGGGLFLRELKKFLTAGFVERGLFGREELIRKLMGSPASVSELTGVEKDVAVQGYEHAVKQLFLVSDVRFEASLELIFRLGQIGSIMALMMTAVQAGTGWRPFADIVRAEEEEEALLGRGDGDASDSDLDNV